MLDFLQGNFDTFVYMIVLACGSVFAIVNFFRTGNVKKLQNELKELFDNMKFRLPDYQEQKGFDKSTVSQDFTGSHLKKDYVLNEVEDVLVEKPEKIDIQKMIDSCVETSLERALQRYLPQDVQDVDEVADFTAVSNDLENFSQVIDIAEEYREKYGLSDDMSVSDIYNYINNLADDLKKGIKKAVEPKQVINVEEVKNEKKN